MPERPQQIMLKRWIAPPSPAGVLLVSPCYCLSLRRAWVSARVPSAARCRAPPFYTPVLQRLTARAIPSMTGQPCCDVGGTILGTHRSRAALRHQTDYEQSRTARPNGLRAEPHCVTKRTTTSRAALHYQTDYFEQSRPATPNGLLMRHHRSRAELLEQTGENQLPNQGIEMTRLTPRQRSGSAS